MRFSFFGASIALIKGMRLVFIGFVLLFSIGASAASLCSKAQTVVEQFLAPSNDDELLQSISYFQTRLNDLIEEAPNQAAVYLDAPANSLHLMIAKLGEESLPAMKKRLRKLAFELNAATVELSRWNFRQNTHTLADLLENPVYVEAGKVYEARSYSGKISRFVFSEKIVKEVFRTKSDFYVKAVNQSLKAMIKGMVPGFSTGANGIKVIHSGPPQVFEVAIIGNNVGKFRFMGYIRNQTFYVNHFYQNADHSTFMREVPHVIDRIED